MHRNLIRILLSTFLFAQPALAAVELITPEGQRVRLNDDHTWDYVSPDSAQQLSESQQPYALLRVSHFDELDGRACRLGVILQNNLPYKIKSLAIRFSAYKSESIPYDSVTRSFSEIKPTDRQYRKLLFRNIECSAIHHIKVEDPGHCSMGKLDRFSAQSGDCIEHIKIEPSELVKISE